ncbi:DUF11 domain-containing protein [Sphingomonas montanisoli]|uniref:DUF11 domain-containing protein n=1 Tax=Sphingomonas montanisoli TaxID=2606412 RepID=A0A5D9CBZ8_9SPHN|nr:DUF11 domain-containing protein [Sphingomonas montanisoli]TZG29478.1 DUF11 domain-containing protein [Sphingomonas montanisoli]
MRLLELRIGRRAWAGAVASATALIACLSINPVHAATEAGTAIRNVAQVQYGIDGQTSTIASNPVSTRVDELIDFTVDPLPACSNPTGDVTAVGFEILNTGNGDESFIIGEPVATGNFQVTGLAADANDNGCYEPGIDPRIPAGTETPLLRPFARYRVFVLGTGTLDGSTVELPVSSRFGRRRVGEVITGAGESGSDVVIGGTGGHVNGRPIRTTSVQEVQAELVKTQAIKARDGSETPMRGAIITYTLEGRFTGGGTASDVVIADPIPAGTAYVAGSLKLDGAALSDAGDGDAGNFNGSGISVALGNVPAPATRTVSFQVRIQ